MSQNGAETFRVEDTMIRMAQACHQPAQSFVTPTGIVFSLGTDNQTHLIRVSERRVNLNLVTEVNTISRRFCSGHLSLSETHAALVAVEQSNHQYPVPLQILMAAIASGCFLIMFGGVWNDFAAAVVCGGLGFALALYLHHITRIRFFSEFLASLALGLMAIGCTRIGIGEMEDKIIIASVMPLVPGLLITNAIRDLMAGHLMAGVAKGTEAVLTAMAIGAGVAVTLTLI